MLPLALVALVFSACGIAFGSAPEGNEFFKSIAVTGELRTGAPLTVAFGYSQNNPIAVTIKCEVRQKKELVKEVGVTDAPGLAFGGASATPFPGNYTFDFTLDAPGAYKLQCYTPADEDNFIEKEFTVLPGDNATPTPLPASEL
jgi:hypothetical protein